MSGRIDVHALEGSLEADILDSARGRSESTVREWDRYRRQGHQRRVAPAYRATVRLTGKRCANPITSR